MSAFRLVRSALARVAPRTAFTASVSRVSVASNLAFRPALFARGFASAASEDAEEEALAIATANAKTRREFVKMLDTEVKALAEEATGAEDMNEFIESLGMEISAPDSNGDIVAEFDTEGYHFRVLFNMDPERNRRDDDAYDPEHEHEHEGETEGREAVAEGEEGEEEEDINPEHEFIVELNKIGKKRVLVAECFAELNGDLEIDSVNVRVEAGAAGTPLDMSDFPEDLLKPFVNVLQTIGLDNRISLFVQLHSKNARLTHQKTIMEGVSAFLKEK